MKRRFISALILSLGFAVSCSNSHAHNKDSSTTEKTKAEPQVETPHSNTEIKLILNDGAKWNSDESTFTGMKRLESALFNFNEKFINPSIVDYNKLGEALANIDNDIISQCSMQGEDHDQLHVLLAPMLRNVAVIKNGNDPVKIKENTKALSEALEQFFEHFEVY